MCQSRKSFLHMGEQKRAGFLIVKYSFLASAYLTNTLSFHFYAHSLRNPKLSQLASFKNPSLTSAMKGMAAMPQAAQSFSAASIAAAQAHARLTQKSKVPGGFVSTLSAADNSVSSWQRSKEQQAQSLAQSQSQSQSQSAGEKRKIAAMNGSCNVSGSKSSDKTNPTVSVPSLQGSAGNNSSSSTGTTTITAGTGSATEESSSSEPAAVVSNLDTYATAAVTAVAASSVAPSAKLQSKAQLIAHYQQKAIAQSAAKAASSNSNV
jgi:hypothetical protein